MAIGKLGSTSSAFGLSFSYPLRRERPRQVRAEMYVLQSKDGRISFLVIHIGDPKSSDNHLDIYAGVHQRYSMVKKELAVHRPEEQPRTRQSYPTDQGDV